MTMRELRYASVVFFFACIAFAAFRASAQAQELPTVEALRARITAATGTPPPSSYKRIRYTASGRSGTEITVRAGDDFRETDSFGPLSTARGRYQKQDWHQNANGQTVLEQPDPGNAIEDTYTTTVSRVSVPFDAFVIARLNGAGSGTREYVDPVTSRIVRRDDLRPTDTTVVTFDDFHTVEGYTSAWHWTRRDGHPENDADYQIEALTARPIATAEIEVARPRRALVEFPAGRTTVDLPVQLVRNKFIVRVMVNGRGLDFELDTGASRIVLDGAVARQLGLHSIARFSNAANAGRISETSVVVPEMSIGDLRMHDVAVSTVPLFEESEDVKVVGLLGFDFIAELALRLDYEHGRVSATQGDVQVDTSAPGSMVLDVRLGTGQALTNVTIDGALGERFIIDTGGAGSLLINDYFARRYPHALVDRGGGRNRNARFIGVGGNIDIEPYQLPKVKIGNVTFENYVGYRVMERRSYSGNVDGLIGADLLRFFTVWLDYSNSRIFLVPNSEGRRTIK